MAEAGEPSTSTRTFRSTMRSARSICPSCSMTLFAAYASPRMPFYPSRPPPRSTGEGGETKLLSRHAGRGVKVIPSGHIPNITSSSGRTRSRATPFGHSGHRRRGGFAADASRDATSSARSLGATQSSTIKRRSRCGCVRGCLVPSSHFSPGAASQAGQRHGA
jgi:hypothetical protein